MLRCETAKTKKLKFGTAISGVQATDLIVNLKIKLDGVYHLIPCQVIGNKIIVEIPALTDLTKSEIKVGQLIPVELEVRVGDHIQTPFADNMQVIKKTIDIEITSVETTSQISNENRVKDIIKAISESEYQTGKAKKGDTASKAKSKSSFFKSMWA